MGRVRRECGEIVDIVWRECADTVYRVWNDCGYSVEIVRIERVFKGFGESVGRVWI